MGDLKSGPLVIGKAVLSPRSILVDRFSDGQAFGGFPFYDQSCPVPKQVDADEMNQQYETSRIVVNKCTHHIRFEDETEDQATVVIEPK